jgi:hypothetical protein
MSDQAQKPAVDQETSVAAASTPAADADPSTVSAEAAAVPAEGGGFAPLASPPEADPASVVNPEMAEPQPTEVEPAPESPKGPHLEDELERLSLLATESALQAVASSAAAQKIEALSVLVLDAAELANRSAAAGAAAGAKLLETQTALEAELARARKHNKIALGVAGGVALATVVLTAAVVTQVSSRLAKLDATLLAVGKRYVEMNAGLESLTLLNDSLAEMQAKQDAFAQLQAKLTTNLEEASKASQGLVTQVPQATAKEVQARTAALMQQVQSIDSRVAAQGNAVKKMADEVKAMQGQQENLGALKRDVEALVVLQRERYLEAAKAAGVAPSPKGPVAAPPPPRTVQYPRPQPPTPEGAAPATTAPVSR